MSPRAKKECPCSACDAVRGKAISLVLANHYPELNLRVPCPIMAPMDAYGTISGIITDLNDHYGWSREEIADWLDTLRL